MFTGTKGQCYVCINSGITLESAAQMRAEREKALALEDPMREQAKSIWLTTETAPSGLAIEKRLGIVTAECAFGMHLFKDIFAAARDIFGGRSDTVQSTLKQARNSALEELRLEAAALGADAVIAVDLDYSEISGGGKSMLFLVASGTAVTFSSQA